MARSLRSISSPTPAVIVTNPKSRRCATATASSASPLRNPAAPNGEPPVDVHLLLTRYYDPGRVAKGEMLAVDDVKEIDPLLG